ncbi:MAG: adenylate/guanylate cyclase domain-containing protein [bacterium]
MRSPIERVFFHERYEFDRGIGTLLGELSSCSSPAELSRLTGEGLMTLVNPDTCALYSREGDSFVPLFAGGSAVPPGFDSHTPLVATLRARSQPMCLDERTDPNSHSHLDPFDRAVLETLGARVIVPIALESELALILCLGAKGSGDVYTPTDVALLSSLAHTISQTLARFDEATLGKKMRKLNESLRRYVPDAIAEVIDGGNELQATTREVSVLFVDLRGYTSLSESREAEQIFGAINRYTEAVSRSVRNHGGTVVEFNGDGMMAVFGAPDSLANKEAAALAAAREMAAKVPLLAGPGGESGDMRVGVGIATGDAFVGNIRAADRFIWSAIGNTTNLAARLEASTRELNVDVVIDELTWERAAHHATDFVEHPSMVVRGRANPLTVYALGMA